MISRRQFLRSTVLSSVFFMSGTSWTQSKRKRPNIIFILADDMSYRDLSAYGQQKFRTPVLDMLAENGVRFAQSYSGAQECAPARGTLMTGLHTGHCTIRRNMSARKQDHLNAEDITIAEVLKTAGYATGFVGKWGIGLPGTAGVPYKQGFDYTFGFYDQLRAHTYFPEYLFENENKIEYLGNIGFDMVRQYKRNRTLPENQDSNVYDEHGNFSPPEIKHPDKMVYSQLEMDKAVAKFITSHKNKPFFLYFAPQLPHGPTMVDNLGELKDRNDFPSVSQKEWAAMVKRLDTSTGRLIELLKKEGVYENTIIFFASDNGYSMCGYFGRGNRENNWPDDPFLKNKGPFTGGKFSTLEGGIRVPFFVFWEGKIKPTVSDEPVWLIDFFPTAAALAGAKIKHEIDGLNLLPLLTGDKVGFKGHDYFYWENQHEQAVRMGPWKAYRRHPDEPLKLYLVTEDTFGERDLSAFYPDIVKKVKDIMKKEHVDSPWYQNPGESDEDFNAKKQKAKELGLMQVSKYANGIKKRTW